MKYYAVYLDGIPKDPENPPGLWRLTDDGGTGWYLGRDGQWHEAAQIIIEILHETEHDIVEIPPRRAAILLAKVGAKVEEVER